MVIYRILLNLNYIPQLSYLNNWKENFEKVPEPTSFSYYWNMARYLLVAFMKKMDGNPQ